MGAVVAMSRRDPTLLRAIGEALIGGPVDPRVAPMVREVLDLPLEASELELAAEIFRFNQRCGRRGVL